MKKLTKILFLILLLNAIRYPLNASYAAVPHLINYQGKLTDSEGIPLNGAYDLTFRIYDAETAGQLLWEETQSGVVIQKGLFNILLGSVTNLDLPFDKQYYLEIKVGNEVMSPRQRITNAGYAIRAEVAENAEKIKISSDDTAAGYLEQKVTKSIVVTNNKLELVNDNASPGNNKSYGTDSSGTKGWYLKSGYLNIQVFTSSGIFTKPAGVDKVFVEVVGGGGGGAAAGGGGGGYSAKICILTGDVSVTVGSGGGYNQNGGTSSFGLFCSATGGSSAPSLYQGKGGTGGVGSNGDINCKGSDGGFSDNWNGNGGSSFYGGGGSAGGGGGGVGNNGGNYGGGGGGAQSGAGNGAPGIVIVRW